MARSHRDLEEEQERQQEQEQERQRQQKHGAVVGNAADPADPNHVVTVGEEQMARSNEMQKVGVDAYMKAHSGGELPEEERERERQQHEQAQQRSRR